MKPDEQTFTHMEFNNNQPSSTRPASHPLLVLDATINCVIYSKVNARAAAMSVKTKLTAMPDTGATMCIMGRSMLDQLKMDRSEVVKVTERPVAANGDQIALGGAVFLDLAHGGRKTMQMVYVSAQVKHMLL